MNRLYSIKKIMSDFREDKITVELANDLLKPFGYTLRDPIRKGSYLFFPL